VLLVCTLIFVLEFLRLETGENALLAATNAFMVAVTGHFCGPRGTLAITAATLTLGAKDLVRGNAIMRKLSSVETLGSVTVICSDKTGTLTKGEMTVRQIYVNKHPQMYPVLAMSLKVNSNGGSSAPRSHHSSSSFSNSSYLTHF